MVVIDIVVVFYVMLIQEISELRYSYLPVCPWSKSCIAHTTLQQQQTGHAQSYFASPSKNAALQSKEKVEKKKEGVMESVMH